MAGPRTYLFRNIPNLVSILGVLPLAILFLEDGFAYLLPLLVYNNVMDDLDGILARALDLKSDFGAVLDNVCDAVAHVLVVMAVGMHFGGLCALLSLVAVVSIMARVVSRLTPVPKTGTGSPTNELIRHIFFALIIATHLDIAAEPILSMVLILNAVSMQVPYPLVFSIRSLATSTPAVGLVNLALGVAWILPVTALPIGAAFAGTYLYSLGQGAILWRQQNAA
ncbi:MAG: CDP-alcohol phosphatidyltransferase family protein [Deltaproteobacteria bacterium]